MLKPTASHSPEDLRKNILSTYFFIRVGIVAISGALPIALLAYSVFVHHTLSQHSMSAFYGADDGAMRNWFVGSLCAIGAFLILYKGFTFAEEIALDAAGFAAILVAFKPCGCWDGGVSSRLHLGFAFSFFISMAAVCFFCAQSTLTLIKDPDTRNSFKRKYQLIGLALFLSPFAAVPASFASGSIQNVTFFVEWFAVWVFAFYWYTKTREFEGTAAEKRALRGELQYRKGVGVVDTMDPIPPGNASKRMAGTA